MADERLLSDIVSKFLLNTCRLRPQITRHAINAAHFCARSATRRSEADCISLTTGSVAEFYIEPMLPLVGDIDVMSHLTIQLAILQGHAPPTQLPAEFSNSVIVYEIVDSHLPGYVYLEQRCLLKECIDNDTYQEFTYYSREYLPHCHAFERVGLSIHGPAECINVGDKYLSVDGVLCVRCLSWPSQAEDWPTRHRNYDWPDSATVGHVVNNGCDVVRKAHPLCGQDERMSNIQWRLSFSRAEIVLLNSWIPVQQIVYHVLRIFVKTELMPNCDTSEALSNYHMKTLMMWASEVESSSFWIDDLNVIRICVELLHSLSSRLTVALCPHYFVTNCNLIHNFFGEELIASQLMSIDEVLLSTWFVNNYLQKCFLLCPDRISRLFNDVSTNSKLQNAVSAVVNWRLSSALKDTWIVLHLAELIIHRHVSTHSMTVRSCVCCMTELAKTDLAAYFTAVAFLHVAQKIAKNGFTDESMDVLATITGQFVSTRHHSSQCNSELSPSKATKLVKVIARGLHSTPQSTEIKLTSLTDLTTSELVELLQRSAVEHLTTYRQFEVRDFSSVATIVTTDFEALYAYKHCDYQWCLQLSTQNVHTLLYSVDMPRISTFPEFIQLILPCILPCVASRGSDLHEA